MFYKIKNYLKLEALVMIFVFLFVQIVFPFSVYASTLNVDFSANPSSGAAPLNDVDLSASVSGTATGDITYKFDCTNNGTWERTVTTSNTSYTASDLCDYFNPGTYTAKVRVERENLTFEGTTAVFVQSGSTLFVDLSANPSSGPVPLNDVDLTASVSGTASGDIIYKFDCQSDGSWERTITTSNTSYTAVDLCDYPNSGNYTARVRVERENLVFQGTAAIFVIEPATLFVDLSANPSSGAAPLNNVDLTAPVSGTATGDITYRFDCTNDGSWERTITTSTNPYTAIDLCDYSNPGNYTARVRVERGGLTADDTVGISVQNPLTLQLSISANPSSGAAPLNDVDLIASVSGTATGDITYKFDCTNNGTWERTVTTSNTSYTAMDLCDYSNPGVYNIKVSAERGNLKIQGTIQVVLGETATLMVDFYVNPSYGLVPLNDVDLTAHLSGTATGDSTYRFDCQSNGTWERTVTTSNNSYTASNLCNYYYPGVYTVKTRVERGGVMVEGTATIIVSSE